MKQLIKFLLENGVSTKKILKSVEEQGFEFRHTNYENSCTVELCEMNSPKADFQYYLIPSREILEQWATTDRGFRLYGCEPISELEYEREMQFHNLDSQTHEG